MVPEGRLVTEHAPTIRGLKQTDMHFYGTYVLARVTEHAPTIRGLKPSISAEASVSTASR